MAKITIHGQYGSPFEGESYTLDTDRKYDGWKERKPTREDGDILCHIQPFLGIPLTLNIAIRKDGSLFFRSWEWNGGGNNYLHTMDTLPPHLLDREPPTEEQIDTVNGLFSGRIKFEGLKLPVGASLQEICPIDVKKEEKKSGKRSIWREECRIAG